MVTLFVAGLLLAGTLLGGDDDFPFGPFRMFSTTDQLDAPVADTRLDGQAADGMPVELTEDNTGIRRAEIEGQLDRFVADPALLAAVARAYAARHPGAPPLVHIAIMVRWHELRHGRPTGEFHDETRVVWSASGIGR